MGACLSSTVDSFDTNCAFVISNRGELRHYPTPIFVSEVLQSEKQQLSFFVCSSDSLYYDKQIPALDSDDELDASQIYFILPITMLGRHLSASHMAALAVKASVALDSNSNSNSNSEHNYKKNKARISPLVNVDDEYENNEIDNNNKQRRGLRVSRSGGYIRKSNGRSSYSSSSSKKAGRLPLRSFRLGLSTIYENDGCDI